MAMFGSSWSDDSEEIGPLSHWTEDFTDDIDDGPMVPSSWKEDYIESPIDKLELCKQLRRKTGMGLLNAKGCLKDNNWNLKQAYENHRSYMWDGKLK